MMTSGDHVVCKACGFQIEIDQSRLTKYPNGQALSNPLGLKQIVTCTSCDFGQTLPDPTQADLDTYYASGQYWDEHKEDKLLEAHQKVQADMRLSTVLHLLPTGRNVRVLDIGAGLGFLGDELTKWASRVNGTGVYYCAVEPDVPTSTRASGRLKAQRLDCQVVTSLGEAGDDFDIIFLNHVLEHVHDPIAFLKNVSGRLSKSGTLYVEVPHRDDRFKTDVFPHVLFFSVTALRSVAERAGFSVRFCEAFGATERTDATPMWRFGARVRRAVLGRVFNSAVKCDSRVLFRWADHKLYKYESNENGTWLRAGIGAQGF